MNTYARLPELSDESLIGGRVSGRIIAGWIVMGVASWGLVIGGISALVIWVL